MLNLLWNKITSFWPKKLNVKLQNSSESVVFVSSIENERINELPLRQFDGTIYVVDSLQRFEQVWPLLEGETCWGFDTETRPSFKKGKHFDVSLLQLANSSHAFLFRLHKIGLPDPLRKLLANPGIKKIGAAVKDDIRMLNHVARFNPNGFVDLQHMATDFNIENKSLKKLAAIILNIRITKSQQLSNWESEELTDPQQLYAATDAWVCYEMYKKLTGLNGYSVSSKHL